MEPVDKLLSSCRDTIRCGVTLRASLQIQNDANNLSLISQSQFEEMIVYLKHHLSFSRWDPGRVYEEWLWITWQATG